MANLMSETMQIAIDNGNQAKIIAVDNIGPSDSLGAITNWYEWLYNKIEGEMNHCKNVDCAYYNGQVNFACVAGLITQDQRDKLTAMIPEY